MNRKIFLILPLLVFVLIFASTVTATTSLTYDYDANGNLIKGDGKYYEYNDANQLIRVKYGDANGTVLAEYFYDYTGQRIKKIENGVTTYYIGKHFEKQVDSTGSATNTSYYFANGERVAKKDSLGNISYYHSDHLGGTNVVSDSSGNLIERIKYYSFGEIREGGNEKYSFTGKEKDKLTDFYYFEARYYNPEFKHFTQADTIEPNLYDPQDLNRYAYVRNNPLKFTDPSGHKAVWWKPWTWFQKDSANSESQNNNSTDGNQATVTTNQKSNDTGAAKTQTPACISMLCKDNSYGKKEVYITAREKSSDIKKPMADTPQPDPGSVILGSGKTAAGLAELGGGIAAAVPGLSIAASGVVACASVAGCVATVPTVAYGLAIASPGIAAMTKGGFDTLEGIGDIYSGFTGKTSPFDNPLDFGAIPDPW